MWATNQGYLNAVHECAASLGDVPVLLCQDAKKWVEESDALQTILQAGRLDLAMATAQAGNGWSINDGKGCSIRDEGTACSWQGLVD